MKQARYDDKSVGSLGDISGILECDDADVGNSRKRLRGEDDRAAMSEAMRRQIDKSRCAFAFSSENNPARIYWEASWKNAMRNEYRKASREIENEKSGPNAITMRASSKFTTGNYTLGDVLAIAKRWISWLSARIYGEPPDVTMPVAYVCPEKFKADAPRAPRRKVRRRRDGRRLAT